jgi:hypothetical protein
MKRRSTGSRPAPAPAAARRRGLKWPVAFDAANGAVGPDDAKAGVEYHYQLGDVRVPLVLRATAAPTRANPTDRGIRPHLVAADAARSASQHGDLATEGAVTENVRWSEESDSESPTDHDDAAIQSNDIKNGGPATAPLLTAAAANPTTRKTQSTHPAAAKTTVTGAHQALNAARSADTALPTALFENTAANAARATPPTLAMVANVSGPIGTGAVAEAEVRRVRRRVAAHFALAPSATRSVSTAAILAGLGSCSLSSWHLLWQSFAKPDCREVRIAENRADVRTPEGVTIEVQRSRIDPDDVVSRNRTYRRVVWILDAQRALIVPLGFLASRNLGAISMERTNQQHGPGPEIGLDIGPFRASAALSSLPPMPTVLPFDLTAEQSPPSTQSCDQTNAGISGGIFERFRFRVGENAVAGVGPADPRVPQPQTADDLKTDAEAASADRSWVRVYLDVGMPDHVLHVRRCHRRFRPGQPRAIPAGSMSRDSTTAIVVASSAGRDGLSANSGTSGAGGTSGGTSGGSSGDGVAIGDAGGWSGGWRVSAEVVSLRTFLSQEFGAALIGPESVVEQLERQRRRLIRLECGGVFQRDLVSLLTAAARAESDGWRRRCEVVETMVCLLNGRIADLERLSGDGLALRKVGRLCSVCSQPFPLKTPSDNRCPVCVFRDLAKIDDRTDVDCYKCGQFVPLTTVRQEPSSGRFYCATCAHPCGTLNCRNFAFNRSRICTLCSVSSIHPWKL